MSGEHDFEPIRGLPRRLPDGERILLQASPDWRSLARQVFHIRFVAAYFLALVLWRAVSGAASGETAAAILEGALPLVMLATLALGVLGVLAYVTARATIYTVTNKRVVFRIGAALPKAVNVPFAVVSAAAFKAHADGCGDVALQVGGPARIGYAPMWPHVRPFRFAKPEPSLRCLANARDVAKAIADALTAAHGANASAALAPAGIPSPAPQPSSMPAPAPASGPAPAAA